VPQAPGNVEEAIAQISSDIEGGRVEREPEDVRIAEVFELPLEPIREGFAKARARAIAEVTKPAAEKPFVRRPIRSSEELEQEELRRYFPNGVPHTEKEEPKIEPVQAQVALDGEVIQPSADDEIVELEAKLEAKRALVITNQRQRLVTPAMAAQKPEIAMNEINKKHAVITNLGGKCVVMEWVLSDINLEWEEPSYQSLTSFRERYANRYVQLIGVVRKIEIVAPEPMAPWWLCHPSRRQFDGIDLEPKGPAILKGNRLNLWRGFGVQPEAGDWSLLQRHLHEVLASSDQRSEDYVRRWTAWKLQNPGERAEVALNFKGKKGSGKGVWMHAMLKIFGPHGMLISNRQHLTGKHNKHLQNRLLLCADEAVWAGDKDAERVLKSLVTERTMTIEPKGIDAFNWANRLGIIQSTNDKWVVPASEDERRYAVFEACPIYMQQKEYFVPLFSEIENGGAAAMLYDLQRLDLEGWHPRYDIPQTEALVDQKVNSLGGMDQWWLAKLNNAETPTPQKGNPRWVLAKSLYEDCKAYSPRSTHITDDEFGRFLRELGCEHKRTAKAWGWIFPPLPEARSAWELRMGRKWDWLVSATEWNQRGET